MDNTLPQPAATKRIRPPYSREFIDCTCRAVDKDDCRCAKGASALPDDSTASAGVPELGGPLPS